MSLDLYLIIEQVQKMATNLKQLYQGKEAKLDLAIEAAELSTSDFVKLKEKIDKAKTTWLVAGLNESIKTRKTPTGCPHDFIVLATDGSHIDVDRHQSTHCFLINIGGIKLQYGSQPDAVFFNQPRVYYQEDEVVLKSTDNRPIPIEGQILGIKRSVEELRVLAEESCKLESDLPLLALLDGTLTLWGLIGQEYQDTIINELITRGFIRYLDDLKTMAGKRNTALASYISFPRSTEVVNAIRIAICPHERVNCDLYCKNVDAECNKLSGLVDRDIFSKILQVGERSATFSSRSSIVRNYYGVHGINFFYIRLENEVVRVEIPRWVAEDDKLIGLVHSVLLQQCELGVGYPVALMEAHEKAVITGAEREQFWRLVEQVMSEESIVISTSAKNKSKRFKWV
jgi:hypothetical protein